MEESKMKGKFVVIDGLDGVGKGVGIDAIIEFLELQGKRVLNLDKYWMENGFHPDFENNNSDYYVDLNSFDVIRSSEPTFTGTGFSIREEVIKKNSRKYSARFTAECYSNDRMVLYRRIILPALDAGKIIIQSRSVSTSITYQVLQSKEQKENDLSIEEIIKMEGNAFALSHPMNLLIVPTIQNPEDLEKRLQNRTEKNDDCNFEQLDFQKKLKPIYESQDFQMIFKSRGVKVVYIDASISIEETKRQAIEAFKAIL
ncbi:MAG: hypothetical protein PHH83_02095 [Patescibacteria group bacterium]|nr:hypothetical protein [Patescibacteria group bacterium]